MPHNGKTDGMSRVPTLLTHSTLTNVDNNEN